MVVKELIKALIDLPADCEVCFDAEDGVIKNYTPVKTVRLVENELLPQPFVALENK